MHTREDSQILTTALASPSATPREFAESGFRKSLAASPIVT